MIPQVMRLKDHGKLHVARGVQARYSVSETGITSTPMSLTIECFDGSGTPINDSAYSSTLYFDRDGKVVDRAPMRTWTTTRQMQERYAGKLNSRMRGVVGKPEMTAILRGIDGFFKGEDGIKRIDDRFKALGGKTLVSEWL